MIKKKGIKSPSLDQVIKYTKLSTNTLDFVDQLFSAPQLIYTNNSKETVASVSQVL